MKKLTFILTIIFGSRYARTGYKQLWMLKSYLDGSEETNLLFEGKEDKINVNSRHQPLATVGTLSTSVQPKLVEIPKKLLK